MYGVILAGWASLKVCILGSMRISSSNYCVRDSHEFCSSWCVNTLWSLNLQVIIQEQSGSILNWFWIPLFPLFLIYFIAGVAETNRAPFDVSEGESEIVAGFHVEYSGGICDVFLAEYMNLILISILSVSCFLEVGYLLFKEHF